MRPFKKTFRHHDSVLGSRAPETKDVPDDAVVPLADDELEGSLLPSLTAARAPASRARGKLDATSREEPSFDSIKLSLCGGLSNIIWEGHLKFDVVISYV